MITTLLMGTKKQFKMYLSDDLLDRLKAAAEKVGKGSSQEVAEEILSIYLPVWTNVNDSMNRAVQYQINKVSEDTIKSAVSVASQKKAAQSSQTGSVKAKKPENEKLNFSGKSTRTKKDREAALTDLMDKEIERRKNEK